MTSAPKLPPGPAFRLVFNPGMPPIAWMNYEPKLCSICFGRLPDEALMLHHAGKAAAFCDACVDHWIKSESIPT